MPQQTSTSSRPVRLTRQLVSHPQTPSPGVAGIEVHIANTSDDKICLSYLLQGDLDTIIIPPEVSEGQAQLHTDNLWQHTCFEVFLMPGNGPGYLEYNFSPSGEWARYMFRDYRQADDEQSAAQNDEPAPVIRMHRSENSLRLDVELSPAVTGASLVEHSWRVGLSAVVEAADGSLCYWALRHPPGKPDFHHADAFTLRFDLPGG